jgi:nitroreductase
LQPWKFVVVENTQTREELKKHSWNQPQIVDASHLLVLCNIENLNSGYISNFLGLISDER